MSHIDTDIVLIEVEQSACGTGWIVRTDCGVVVVLDSEFNFVQASPRYYKANLPVMDWFQELREAFPEAFQ